MQGGWQASAKSGQRRRLSPSEGNTSFLIKDRWRLPLRPATENVTSCNAICRLAEVTKLIFLTLLPSDTLWNIYFWKSPRSCVKGQTKITSREDVCLLQVIFILLSVWELTTTTTNPHRLIMTHSVITLLGLLILFSLLLWLCVWNLSFF